MSNWKRLGLSVVCVVILSHMCLAIEPYSPKFTDAVNEPWRWRNFPELNGLGLRCLIEGPTGHMWFGTDEGIHVYKGLDWTVWGEQHGLVGTPVHALCKAENGVVYAGTEKGISRFEKGKWTTVFPPEGDVHWPVTNLTLGSDQSIWASTRWGALRLDGQKAWVYSSAKMVDALKLIAPYVTGIAVDEHAVVHKKWESQIGVLVGEAGADDLGELVVYGVAENGPAAQVGVQVGDRILSVDGITSDVDMVSALEGPMDSRVLLTVRPQGQSKPVKYNMRRVHQVAGVYPHFNVYDIFESAEGTLWMGLFEGDIVHHNPNKRGKQAWQRFTQADGLNLGEEPRIGQTKEGTILTISNTSQGGVNTFNGKQWKSVSMSLLGGSDIHSSIIQGKDGTTWIGGNTLFALRKGVWTAYARQLADGTQLPLPSHRMRLFQSSDGALWMAGLGQAAARLDYNSDRWQTFDGLIYQCQTPNDDQWFLSDSDSVVRFDGTSWVQYTTQDGVIDQPLSVHTSREGLVWVIGSEQNKAAVSWFDGKKWTQKTFPHISWAFDRRAFLEASNGDIWLAGAVDMVAEENQVGGIVRFRNGQWDVYNSFATPAFAYGIGESKGGVIWFVGQGVYLFDQGTWLRVAQPRNLAKFWTDAIWSSPDGELWIGSRSYGVFHFDGETWQRYDMYDGLAENGVSGLNQGPDGTLWATTSMGVSRFDGRQWKTQALPQAVTAILGGGLHIDRHNTVWLNQTEGGWDRRAWPSEIGTTKSKFDMRTVRYRLDKAPPETQVTLFTDRVSMPGNTVFAWKGRDPWQDTPQDQLEFSWRIDNSPWSHFTQSRYQLLEGLSNGKRVFEVRARDRELNIDATPARVEFTVGP